MQNLLKIENLLPDLNNEDFEQLQKIIKTQIANNKKSFEKAIDQGDTDNIKQYSEKITFDNDYLKFFQSRIVPHIKSLHYLSKNPIKGPEVSLNYSESIETFHLLFQDVLGLDDYPTFQKHVLKEKPTFPLSDVLFCHLFNRLAVSFQYDENEPYPKYLFLKAFFKKNPALFKPTIDSFTRSSLHKLDYQENSLFIKELIDLGYKEVLFDQAKNEKNYDYMKTFFPVKSGYNNEFMIKGLSIFNLSMVKQSFKNGIPFFISDESLSDKEKTNYKDIFSKVFASKDSFSIQEYIIDNIPDISIGNHIIIKTIFHKLENKYETDSERNTKRIELIQAILYRYNELESDKIIEVKSLVEKRPDSITKECTTEFLRKLINYNTLNHQLAPNYQPREKKNKI